MTYAAPQILLRQPEYSLELLRSWDADGEPHHAFVVYSPIQGADKKRKGVKLLKGKGHDVPRRDMHYALYLFQQYHMAREPQTKALHG